MRSTVRAATALPDDDGGSILPLVLGYALLALSMILVCVCATDMYIAQKRLDALADAAALAGADGFVLVVEDGTARAELTDEGVREQAVGIVAAMSADATLVSAASPDGVSARVTVVQTWRPPVISPFVQGWVTLEATATSRTALR